MKKMVVLAAMLFLIVPTFAFGDALTGLIKGDDGSGGDESDIARLSSKVELHWLGDSTGYAIITKHESGTNMYGTAHDSAQIYRSSATDDFDVPSESDSSAFDSDWTAM